jgi:uncharacterized RDD family membrane protein YckC
MSETPEKYSQDLLDTVLSDSGAMPAAHLGIRLQAFILDWVFVSLLASILIWKFAMPQSFPDAFAEMDNWYGEFSEWVLSQMDQKNDTEDTPMPQWSDSLRNAMAYAQLIMFLLFWLYFAIGEAFFSGYTFGKSICRLRTISIITMNKPFLSSSIARAGIKAFALLSPFILFATIIVLKFNKRRQMGHDLLCRTAVVDERYLSSVDQIR